MKTSLKIAEKKLFDGTSRCCRNKCDFFRFRLFPALRLWVRIQEEVNEPYRTREMVSSSEQQVSYAVLRNAVIYGTHDTELGLEDEIMRSGINEGY